MKHLTDIMMTDWLIVAVTYHHNLRLSCFNEQTTEKVGCEEMTPKEWLWFLLKILSSSDH